MKTILVLSAHPDFAETIRAGLNSEQYRVVHRLGAEEAEALLTPGLAAACILDIDLTGVEGVWAIERVRRMNSKLPIIVCTASSHSEWEEEAFLRGVSHVLTKPVGERLLNSLLDRLANPGSRREPPMTLPAQIAAQIAIRAAELSPEGRFGTALKTLDMLRDFSSILTHSLDAEAMLKQFLFFLRETLSVNRAAIFLTRPATPVTDALAPEDNRQLRAVAAIGLSAGLLEHFELSLDSGIGGQIAQLGRILRRDSDEARVDVEAQKEFELLRAQVAVPIPDRGAIAGVAVFDGRVTGEPLVNVELELIFHLLEQVGLALRNTSLHNQLAGNHEMMTGVLRELSSACIVVGRDLKVLHANKAARRHFGRKNQRTAELEFSDLPQALGSKIYQVLKTGAAISPFRHEPENSPGTIYRVSVVPFQRGDSTVPVSALLTADDLTQAEQLQRLEVEAANLRLIRAMADRLAHEVGNAMVPLSTHQQLLGEKFKDREFRESLDRAMADSVKRVTRLVNQMRFLAREGQVEREVFTVENLVEEAYQEARKHQPAETAQLKCESAGESIVITGDRAALKHALAEILLNALQANPRTPMIGVRLQAATNSEGGRNVQIEVQDNGTGFTPEAAGKAPSPFFTTRNVGLGLGLTVSQKIIETHNGRLEIVPPQAGQHGIVRVSLPMEPAIATAA